MRFLLPIGKAVGREGLETGARVLSGYLGGKDLKETVVHESKTGVKNLLEKAAQNLENEKQSGKGFDFKHYKKGAAAAAAIDESAIGKPKRTGRKSIKRPLHSLMAPPSLPNHPLKRGSRKTTTKKNNSSKRKQLRLDTLGFY